MGLFSKKKEYRKVMIDEDKDDDISENEIKAEDLEVTETEEDEELKEIEEERRKIKNKIQSLPKVEDEDEDIKQTIVKAEEKDKIDILEKRISDLESNYNSLNDWCVQFYKVYKKKVK